VFQSLPNSFSAFVFKGTLSRAPTATFDKSTAGETSSTSIKVYQDRIAELEQEREHTLLEVGDLVVCGWLVCCWLVLVLVLVGWDMLLDGCWLYVGVGVWLVGCVLVLVGGWCVVGCVLGLGLGGWVVDGFS
jgi:hypothetical protein